MQSQALCLLISREAKGGNSMTRIAGQYLNIVLEDLKLNRNLKVNRVTTILNVAPGGFGPFALPADYLRPYDLSYPLQGPNGTTQFLTPITMEQWDAEFKGSPTTTYPYEFATDLSTQAQVWSGGSPGVGTLTSAGNIFIFPASNGALAITFRYMKNQPDLVNPETNTNTPWFPFSQYLLKQSAALMMGTTGDDRQPGYLMAAEEMLRPHLIMEGDEQQTVREVRLDPRRFQSNRGLRPTKVNPW